MEPYKVVYQSMYKSSVQTVWTTPITAPSSGQHLLSNPERSLESIWQLNNPIRDYTSFEPVQAHLREIGVSAVHGNKILKYDHETSIVRNVAGSRS